MLHFRFYACRSLLILIPNPKTFKKSLDPRQWNFVELVTNREQGDSDFARKNYRPNLKCDVLVISGHFSGSCVGSRADTLPLKTMESLSCRSECDGIFKAPEQVFLFGSNTLSRVDLIETNPEKFLDHLLATGYSRSAFFTCLVGF